MIQEEIQHRPSDAWVLLAIILAAGNDSACLEEIVAVGDGINHAIFTENEMEGGLFRLSAGGYIEEMGDGFRPTIKGLEEYRLASKRTKVLLDQMGLLRQSLGATVWNFEAVADQFEITFKCSGFTRKRFATAVNYYLTNPSDVLEALSKKKPN
jgi:hypothetical protein